MSDPRIPSRAEQEELLRRANEAADFLFRLTEEARSEARDSTVTGPQTISFDPTPQQLKALAQQHKQTLEADERRHQHEEATKENEVRRIREAAEQSSRLRRESIAYYSVLFVILGSLVTSGIVGVNSKNADTRNFAQGAFLLILGGLVGALAGYFTGKSGT